MRSKQSFSIGINAHANPTISGILVSLLTTRGRAFRKKRQYSQKVSRRLAKDYSIFFGLAIVLGATDKMSL